MIDKDTWDKIVTENGSEFLQSYQWGEFQKSLGKRVERVSTASFLAQIVFNPLGGSFNYGYIGRGPTVIGRADKELFWQKIEETKDKGTIFFELELARPIDFITKPKPKTRQPLKTSILNLEKNEEEIFLSFHKNLRYNIKLSHKKGIQIRKESDWQQFYNLQEKTARRQKFKIWPAGRYQKLWQALKPRGEIEILSAYKGDTIIASNLYILFGERVTYLYGASNHQYRSQMAPHLLHWWAIKQFKKQGFSQYDFWGIDTERWPGITAFKERFGGSEYSYPGFFRKPQKIFLNTVYGLIKG